MSFSKIIAVFLVITFISLYLINFNISALAQVETTVDNGPVSSEAVTSVNDAILKSLVIISQVAVLGIVFNYFFFNRFLNKKRGSKLNNPNENDLYFNIRNLKRVTYIVTICCISIIIFSTASILLQSYQLAQTLDIDVYSAFDISYTTSIGQVWILRVLTSASIIGVMLFSYVVYRKGDKSQNNSENSSKRGVNKIILMNKIPNQYLLLIIIGMSSINLFSNSMVSHSNSLPSFSTFAVSIDWIHYMAVSIWVGGLFSLSLILVKDLKPIGDYDDRSNNNTNTISNISDRLPSLYSMSIALMYFSFIVIIALCVIGISGLYLGYVHLQDLNSVFSTSYGQILILKLGLAFPLIFIGRYNQLKIYKYTSITLELLKHTDSNNNLTQQYNKKSALLFRVLDRSLKIESLLAIFVLIVAAFLSVTSPPSLEAVSQDSLILQGNMSINQSDNSIFLYLIITLAIFISMIGIINIRKNQKQIKSVLP